MRRGSQDITSGRGVEKAGVELLLRSSSVFKSGFETFTDWLAARSWNEQWPLGESDFAILGSSKSYREIAERLLEARTPKWLFGFRDIARSTDERTALFAALPPVGIGNNLPLLFGKFSDPSTLIGCTSSLVFDFMARQKVGGTHMNFFIVEQLPLLAPGTYTLEKQKFIRPRVLELAYTAHDLCGFAEQLCYAGEPYRWDEDRRFLIRCELDAFYFHLYGVSRDDASYILDTFPIVRRKDEQQYGEYRTKSVILEIYDAMAEAERTGVPYETRLDPPPADPRVAHAPREKPEGVLI